LLIPTPVRCAGLQAWALFKHKAELRPRAAFHREIIMLPEVKVDLPNEMLTQFKTTLPLPESDPFPLPRSDGTGC